MPAYLKFYILWLLKYNLLQMLKVDAPLPLGCRGPPVLDGAAVGVCVGAVCDVEMMESIPCVTGV